MLVLQSNTFCATCTFQHTESAIIKFSWVTLLPDRYYLTIRNFRADLFLIGWSLLKQQMLLSNLFLCFILSPFINIWSLCVLYFVLTNTRLRIKVEMHLKFSINWFLFKQSLDTVNGVCDVCCFEFILLINKNSMHLMN